MVVTREVQQPMGDQCERFFFNTIAVCGGLALRGIPGERQITIVI
jgi:hypothetical protein